MIIVKLRGNFDKTEKFFNGSKNLPNKWIDIFEKYANLAIQALQQYTPKDTGLTANKWVYKITKKGFIFTNTNEVDGIPVVILLQYGHATRSGGYVQGVDFINPALRPIFDKISEDCWKEVTSL